MSEATLLLPENDILQLVFGERDRFRRQIRDATGVEIVHRDGEIRFFGDEPAVGQCQGLMKALVTTARRRGQVDESDVRNAIERAGFVEAESIVTTPAPPKSEIQKNTALRRPKLYKQPSSEQQTEHTVDLHERGRTVRPKSPGQDGYLRAMDDNDLVFCIGPAGCGKTYLAVAAAIKALREERVRKIVLVRPAVEAGEKLGFLPGDMLAKVNPYLRPLLDSLVDMLDFEQVERYMAKDVVEIVPLAFMRGRTLNETFIILDEAQNTTVTQMKMFLTRMGEGSQIVVTGDTTQIDLPSNVDSGLNDAVQRLGVIEGVSVVKLGRDDIVRHRLVREIVHAYDQDGKNHSQ
ncbi:PhoH family protein [Calycomorphotria hydatis]|uniref:PhoH-like protein n=1 Tax=Calycomorphotria hydatis TaxID=2528027 RepID=A0A517TC69_9PLAN|nr:PhoH family protein [Calycomorphotria hydatis]QDT65975.1 PhoH-like protein [Calycomorphotria hydatis]